MTERGATILTRGVGGPGGKFTGPSDPPDSFVMHPRDAYAVRRAILRKDAEGRYIP